MTKSTWLIFRPWERHSLVLTISGLGYITLGVSFLVDSDMSVRREEALVVAIHMFPLNTWAALFILAGVFAILSGRWPPSSSSWGYVVLTGFSSAWSAMYLVSYIFGGPFSNISFSLTWGLLAFMWWATSGLVNPSNGQAPYVKSD